MALLWDASLTDVGVSMISQWAQGAGDKLTITGAVIGEGVVAATQLHSLTQLTDQKSTISIQSYESVANGVKLKLRKTSQGITTSFILNQIGIYAKLDTSGGTPIIADSLIAVYQQDTGVLVPTETDSPDFVFTFYGTIQTNYQGDLTINVDTSAILSQDDIADDLVTADATMALSANQGCVLEQQAEAGFNVLGAKNLGIPLEAMTYLNLSTSNSSDGSLTVTTNGLMCGGVNTNWSSPFILKKGTYQVSFGLDTDETPSLTGFAVILKVYSTSYWLCTSGDSAANRKITLAADTEVVWGLYCESGTVVATQTAYPMIRPASIVDPTFAPYAKTNQQLTKDVSGLSNRNLLDNPWFTVNQRGITSGTMSGNRYFYDRWIFTYSTTPGSFVQTSNGVKLTPALNDSVQWWQYLENLTAINGKAITVSILFGDGSIKHGSFVRVSGTSQNIMLDSNTLLQVTIDATDRIAFYVKAEVIIRAVKLEVGTVSTLHLDVAPDYTTELLKCQRYFYRVNQAVATAMFAFVMGLSATVAYAPFRTPVPMRATPSISFGGTFNLVNASDTNAVSTISFSAYTGDLGTLSIGSSNLTPSNMYILTCGTANSYIDFASDL